MKTPVPKIFLTQLAKAEPQAGGLVHLWKNFYTPLQAQQAFDLLNDDTAFHWDLKPKLYGQEMTTQHAFPYRRREGGSSIDTAAPAGVQHLEQLCQDLERRLDCRIPFVYCNRFANAEHQIDWHTDTYASHILVLTLGSERNVEFRPKDEPSQVTTMRPTAGDVYFMPLQVNKTHEHRVCKPVTNNCDDDDNDKTKDCNYDDNQTRISLVFFTQTPKYAKDYRIGWKDMIGGLNKVW